MSLAIVHDTAAKTLMIIGTFVAAIRIGHDASPIANCANALVLPAALNTAVAYGRIGRQIGSRCDRWCGEQNDES